MSMGPAKERAFRASQTSSQMDLRVSIPMTMGPADHGGGNFTLYCVKVSDTRRKINWQVEKRFSEFDTLRQVLFALRGRQD